GGRGQAAGDRDDGPAPEPAALCLAAQHHEGEEEAARREVGRRLRRRCLAAPQGRQDRGAGRAQGRRQGQGRGGAGLQPEVRRRHLRFGTREITTMAILLVAEHDNATLSDQTAKALSAASKIGGDVDILIAGKDAKAAADAAAKLAGVRKVLLAEADGLAERLAEPTAALVVSLADNYDTVIAPATTMGKN